MVMDTMMQVPGDRELVVAFKEGHRGAYEELFKRYQPRVRKVCFRLLGNPADAEEAVQETFLRAYKALPRFNGRYELGAWLARIASNVCVDHLRSRARATLVALPAFDDELVAEPEPGPETAVAEKDPRVGQAIQEIQPLHARALQMRALEEMTHQEMADRLAMSPPQVKALLHRARSSFKKAWEKAEGWILAPLGGARFWNDRSAPSGSTLVGASPGVAPLLAEKVAAASMLVAVALAGIPSTHSDPADIGTPAPAPTMAARGPAGEISRHADAKQADAIPPEATDEPAEEADRKGLLDRSLAGAAHVDHGDAGPRSDRSTEDPLEPPLGQVERTLDETSNEIARKLPPSE